MGLDGIRMLIPHYVHALFRLPFGPSPDYAGQKVDPADELRKGGYQILSSIIFSISQYSAIKLPPSLIGIPQPILENFDTQIQAKVICN